VDEPDNGGQDIIRHAYDDALTVKGYGGVDSVLICAGMLRGDSVYGPGARHTACGPPCPFSWALRRRHYAR
jgi:hypothetical protein